MIAFDHRLERRMAELHRAEHDLFRKLLRLGLDHQHALGGAGENQLQLAGLHLVRGRV